MKCSLRAIVFMGRFTLFLFRSFFYGGFAIGIVCVSGPRPCELGEVISSWTADDSVSDVFLIFVLLNWGGANVTVFFRSPTLLEFF